MHHLCSAIQLHPSVFEKLVFGVCHSVFGMGSKLNVPLHSNFNLQQSGNILTETLWMKMLFLDAALQQQITGWVGGTVTSKKLGIV